MPELVCDKCGADYQVWSAPNDLWNQAIRLHDGSDEWEYLCFWCFALLALFRLRLRFVKESPMLTEKQIMDELESCGDEDRKQTLLDVLELREPRPGEYADPQPVYVDAPWNP